MTSLMMCGHKSDKSDVDGIPYCDCGGAMCYMVDRKRVNPFGGATETPTYDAMAMELLRREAQNINRWAAGTLYGRSPFVINVI